ncbi:MAG: PilN domain-containing protein [Rhodocyclaceae bacterium]|nr:PilN domain-containing protein [Rhodocyclaceae bacterium]
MAQQINLYDPALRRTREWLTLGHLVLLSIGLALVIAVPGGVARLALPALAQRVAANDAQLKALREQIALIGQTRSARKPDPALEQAVTQRRQELEMRLAVLEALKKHAAAAQGEPHADILRGFARQTLAGLWLTGFFVEAGGGMEIRGRTTDPALLPEYIRRLNQEAAFQGRRFAALKLEPGKSETAPAAGAASAAAPPAAEKRAPWHEFMLIPLKPNAPAAKPPGTGRSG